MKAYKINNLVIAADIEEEACEFYRREIDGAPPGMIEELFPSMELYCEDGTVKTIRDRINEELDARNEWLRMGIPCDIHFPFVIGTLP
jgi:hypothetical protein